MIFPFVRQSPVRDKTLSYSLSKSRKVGCTWTCGGGWGGAGGEGTKGKRGGGRGNNLSKNSITSTVTPI